MRRAHRQGTEWPDRAWFGRPLGPAVVEGAVRGTIFGAIEGVALGAAAGFVRSRTGSIDPTAFAAVLASCAAFTGALCMGEAVSFRLFRDVSRGQARFAGGFFAVVLATMPFLAIVVGPRVFLTTLDRFAEVGFGFAFAGGLVGLFAATFGPFLPGAERGDSFVRWRRVVLLLGFFAGCLALPLAGCGGTTVVFLAAPTVGLLAAVPGAALATRASRGVVTWLEPGWQEREEVANRVRRLIFRSRADWKAAASAAEPNEAERLRQQALEQAWNALVETEKDPDRAGDRLETAWWLFELHLELGKPDDALRLLQSVPGQEILRAESRRRGGDPRGALDLAERELGAIKGLSRTGRRLQEAAQAIMALARADLGLHDEAAAGLASARKHREWRDPLLSYQGLDAVAAYLAARRPGA